MTGEEARLEVASKNSEIAAARYHDHLMRERRAHSEKETTLETSISILQAKLNQAESTIKKGRSDLQKERHAQKFDKRIKAAVAKAGKDDNVNWRTKWMRQVDRGQAMENRMKVMTRQLTAKNVEIDEMTKW